MKSLKAAAIVAGSLVVAGFATPALALDAPGSQSGGLGQAVTGITDGVQLNGKKVLDPRQGLAGTLQGATGGLGNGGKLAG
ncbi:hypothetical protein [Streptomyces capitiformicae]|uniref:Secreted protein n=1 Tax=Streptomyces capitiformicae TaxID=2014920 RepID=A0A918ZTY9_9ACTN|nr:hypothetical protein [Streptomyces capitiformicae]GHE70286.1 hypothetical protein GCM10017771_94230 [Streptomyces capitiformicae]